MFKVNVMQLSETIPSHGTTGDQKMYSASSVDLHIPIPSDEFKFSCLNYAFHPVSAILSTQKSLQISSQIRLKVQSQKPHTPAPYNYGLFPGCDFDSLCSLWPH